MLIYIKSKGISKICFKLVINAKIEELEFAWHLVLTAIRTPIKYLREIEIVDGVKLGTSYISLLRFGFGFRHHTSHPAPVRINFSPLIQNTIKNPEPKKDSGLLYNFCWPTRAPFGYAQDKLLALTIEHNKKSRT